MVDDDSREKMWKQLRYYINGTLGENFPMHGYQLLIPDVVDNLMEAVVVHVKRLNGKSVPLTKQVILDRLRRRYKK